MSQGGWPQPPCFPIIRAREKLTHRVNAGCLSLICQSGASEAERPPRQCRGILPIIVDDPIGRSRRRRHHRSPRSLELQPAPRTGIRQQQFRENESGDGTSSRSAAAPARAGRPARRSSHSALKSARASRAREKLTHRVNAGCLSLICQSGASEAERPPRQCRGILPIIVDDPIGRSRRRRHHRSPRSLELQPAPRTGIRQQQFRENESGDGTSSRSAAAPARAGRPARRSSHSALESARASRAREKLTHRVNAGCLSLICQSGASEAERPPRQCRGILPIIVDDPIGRSRRRRHHRSPRSLELQPAPRTGIRQQQFRENESGDGTSSRSAAAPARAGRPARRSSHSALESARASRAREKLTHRVNAGCLSLICQSGASEAERPPRQCRGILPIIVDDPIGRSRRRRHHRSPRSLELQPAPRTGIRQQQFRENESGDGTSSRSAAAPARAGRPARRSSHSALESARASRAREKLTHRVNAGCLSLICQSGASEAERPPRQCRGILPIIVDDPIGRSRRRRHHRSPRSLELQPAPRTGIRQQQFRENESGDGTSSRSAAAPARAGRPARRSSHSALELARASRAREKLTHRVNAGSPTRSDRAAAVIMTP